MRVKAAAGALPLGAIFGAIGVLAGAAVGLLHLDHLPFTVCVFKAVTGWPCLGCGTTRALGRLVHLDARGAFAMNPLAAAGFLALVPWALIDLGLLAWGRALSLDVSSAEARILRVLAVVLVLVNWAYLVAAGR